MCTCDFIVNQIMHAEIYILIQVGWVPMGVQPANHRHFLAPRPPLRIVMHPAKLIFIATAQALDSEGVPQDDFGEAPEIETQA